MILSIIVIIVLAVIIYDKNQYIGQLQLKIQKLEKQVNILLKRLQDNAYIENDSVNVEQYTVKNTVEGKIVSNDTSQDNNFNEHVVVARAVQSKEFNDTWKKIKTVDDEKEKKQLKNTVLLALGAFFIVIAAVSFLYSTWYTVPDFLKTGVILVLAGVFLGISHVADKVFDLKKTASTFFYIAMAYIPICLVSISIFGFVGEYLSLAGDGKFVYLSFISLLVAAIYLIFGYKHNDEKLYYASKFMQVLVVVCVTANFTVKAFDVLCIALLYTIVLNIVDNKFENCFLVQGQLFNDLCVGIISIISVLCSLFATKGELSEILLMFGVLVNAVILYSKKKQVKFFGISYVLSFFALIEILMYKNFDLDFIYYQLSIFAMLIIATIYYNFFEKDLIIRKIINWINLVVMYLVYWNTAKDFNSIDFLMNTEIVKYPMFSILGILGTVMAFVVYIKNNRVQYNLFALTLGASSILLLLPDRVWQYYSFPSYDVSFIGYLISMITAITMFVILFKDKNKYLKVIPLFVLFVNLYRYQWVIGQNFDITYYLNIVLTLVFTFFVIKDREDIVYKITSFAFLIGWFLYGQIDIYIATLIITIFGILQLIFSGDVGKNVIKAIMVFYLLLMYSKLVNYIHMIEAEQYMLSVITSLLFWYAFSKTKWLKALPMLGLIIPVFEYNLVLLEQYDITFIVNLAMVVLFTYMSIIRRKDYIYKFVSFIYLVAFLAKYSEINMYIKHFMLIIWGLCEYLRSQGKLKDIFKFFVITVLLSMYIVVLKDLKMLEITAFLLIGFLIYVHIVTRTILQKYICSYKMLEYVAAVIIYLMAFELYRDVIDLAIFIIAQVFVLMISYARKLGPVFAVTVPAVIINTIYATREFWLAIPWWAYLIVVGGTLIVFAARNELAEKQDINMLKEKLNKVKNYLDM